MKRAHALLFAVGLLALAAAPAGAWHIKSHDVEITLFKDASYEVTEKIVADFGARPKHGIYRYIPYRYRRHGHWLRLDIQVLSVTDAQNISHKYTVQQRHRDVYIKIGDPKRTVTGEKKYHIRYRVEWGINYQEEFDELYWNAIAGNWGDCRSIGPSTIRIELPEDVKAEECGSTAFLGAQGAAGRGLATIETTTRPVQAIVFKTNQTLGPAEGFTIVVGLPKGRIYKPPWYRRAWRFMTHNWPYFMPVVFLVGMTLIWYVRGRDPAGRGTIVVEYEPPDQLSPAEVGTLIDEKVDPRDISSTLIDLAIRGYIRIEPVSEGGLFSKPEVKFVRLKEPGDRLRRHEREMMEGIFIAGEETYLSELRERFYTRLPTITKELYRRLVRRGYFSTSPEKVRSGWQSFAVVIGLGGVASLVFGHDFPFWLATGIGALISAAVVFAFSFVMPRKTHKGRVCWERIRGLVEYINRAEKEQIEESERQGIFERLLPYAMALGVADTWARKFEGIYAEPPSWYAGHPGAVFTTYWLVGSLGNTMGSFQAAAASRPRTSSSHGAGGGFSGFSGGFSGGGFGGGGGGSW
jgi:hypothetical protein